MGHKIMLLFKEKERKPVPVTYLWGRQPVSSPTALALHYMKKYFFSFVLNLLSSNFSVLILCDRQLSDFLPAFFLNLNHPNKLLLTPLLHS